MGFHFCAHSWEVSDRSDGIVVKLRNRDLSSEALPSLVEDLFQLVQESGKPSLYLDLADIGLMSSAAIEQMSALHSTQHAHGGRFFIINVNPTLMESLRATPIADEASSAA